MSKAITIISSAVSILSLAALTILAIKKDPPKKDEVGHHEDDGWRDYHNKSPRGRTMRFQLYIPKDDFDDATYDDDILFPGVDRAVLSDSFIDGFHRAVSGHLPNLMDITPDDDITVEVALDTDIFHIIVDNCTYNEHPDNINRMVDAVGRTIRRQVNDWITDFYSTAKRVQVIWPTR